MLPAEFHAGVAAVERCSGIRGHVFHLVRGVRANRLVKQRLFAGDLVCASSWHQLTGKWTLRIHRGSAQQTLLSRSLK